MSTLDKKRKRTALVYTLITMFCVLFGAVYEMFSHEVFSYFMLYAFAFPLVFGILPPLILGMTQNRRGHSLLSGSLYHFGVAVLTVGSLMSGVLEIYGTSSSLTDLYWIAGGAFLAAGAAVFFLRKPKAEPCRQKLNAEPCRQKLNAEPCRQKPNAEPCRY